MEAPQRWCSTTVAGQCEGWYKREWTVGVRLSYMEAPQRWCSTTVAGQCEGWYKREWTVGVRLSYMEAPQRWCSTTVAGQCEGWYKREWTVGVRLSYMEAPQRWCSTTVAGQWDDIRENGLSVCDWATWRHHNVSVLPLCSGDCRCATELHGGTTTLVFYHCGWTVRGMI